MEFPDIIIIVTEKWEETSQNEYRYFRFRSTFSKYLFQVFVRFLSSLFLLFILNPKLSVCVKMMGESNDSVWVVFPFVHYTFSTSIFIDTKQCISSLFLPLTTVCTVYSSIYLTVTSIMFTNIQDKLTHSTSIHTSLMLNSVVSNFP